jgi:hypothetical protein
MKLIQKLSLFLSLAWLIPAFVKAQSGGVQGGLSGLGTLFPSFGGIASSRTLTGPAGLIYNIINIMLLVGGAIAVLFIIIGGFQYITSAGNEEQAEKGRNTLVNAVIGIVLILLSYVIINVVVNAVTSGRP